jgi:hypothetical protein
MSWRYGYDARPHARTNSYLKLACGAVGFGLRPFYRHAASGLQTMAISTLDVGRVMYTLIAVLWGKRCAACIYAILMTIFDSSMPSRHQGF